MALIAHPSPSGIVPLQHVSHFAPAAAAAPVDAHTQRQRLLNQLNESTWQRIGNSTYQPAMPPDD
jgi:hypothetical protein